MARSLRTNRASLDAVVLGHTISFPVMIAPAGVHHLVHPEGELATA